jgi:hypothetical protein
VFGLFADEWEKVERQLCSIEHYGMKIREGKEV